MAGRSKRRDVLRAGLFGAGLGTLAMSIAPGLAAATGRVAIPETPMRLTRRIESGFGGGERLAVARSWQVLFERGGRGITLSGEQLSAEVEAPADLADIAAIEERRPTAAMWPILCGEDGIILTSSTGIAADQRAAAIRAADRLIAQRRLSEADARRRRAFLAQVHEIGGGLLAHLPDDLFFPRGEPLRRREALILPDGREGEFEVVWLALAAPGRDWLGEAMREIVTRVGADVRRARESWRLETA